ncbi:flagellar assembly protein FliW [Salisediminibacterium halotolerans]|uniref:flagellar assembly protein FliW n=1 Tax=Salisediminibacterium halotolerans TaxID=517425 RepID=UPI000EAC284A|nr:flagellar assembly protein FliW [Salisediminibacterium halotolerans]RLJ75540.1 flagellar assembly factor FliW [Actinophytocola xinjiangensis]RPE89393.1 flagellar assembly factor FliW [Salisediminibacterium halotolerans]TWG36153.1 flagellar assembly factor FliW [Salisediminibacterium halotolerans]GEL07630.1 flagellar assembly factor FliW [Salisediminibacterium halotolerans]
MYIETKYHGKVTVTDEQCLHFNNGIPSFEEEKTFALLPFGEEATPFYILQSTNEPGLAFVVMTPFTFFPDYEAKLSDQTVEDLAIADPAEVQLLVILTLKDTLQASTANLRGPIVVNTRTREAKQIALTETEYHTRHPLKAAQPAGKKGE